MISFRRWLWNVFTVLGSFCLLWVSLSRLIDSNRAGENKASPSELYDMLSPSCWGRRLGRLPDAVYLWRNAAGCISLGEPCHPQDITSMEHFPPWIHYFPDWISLDIILCLRCSDWVISPAILSWYGVSESICSLQTFCPNLGPTGVPLKGDADLAEWCHSLPHETVWFGFLFQVWCQKERAQSNEWGQSLKQ